MKNANVLLFDDNDNVRQLARFWLDRAGHMVVGEATSLDEALATLDAVAQGEPECDILILDGDMSGRGTGQNAVDATLVTSRIREHGLSMKIIGFSAGEPLSDQGVPVDIDFDKMEVSKLPDVIAGL
jgi:CheY-like chemotaxis protein